MPRSNTGRVPQLVEGHELYDDFVSLIKQGKVQKSEGAAKVRRRFPELQDKRYSADRFRSLFNRLKPLMDSRTFTFLTSLCIFYVSDSVI